jgi:hypothetical protein
MKQQKSDDVIRAIKILNLATPFSILDIKNAYKARAKALHPDRDSSDFKGEEGMKEVNWAYHLLLKHLEQVKVPLDLILSTSQTDEEWLKKRFYYDWMPPEKEVETA